MSHIEKNDGKHMCSFRRYVLRNVHNSPYIEQISIKTCHAGHCELMLKTKSIVFD